MKTVRMTATRRKAYARQARRRLLRHEDMLSAVVLDAITSYLDRLRAHFDSRTLLADATSDAAAAAGGFTTSDADEWFDEIVKLGDRAWPGLLDSKIMPTYGKMLDEILGGAMRSGKLAQDLMKWRNDWLAARRQVLVNVPDQIASQLRTELRDLAEQSGTDVFDAKLAVDDMLRAGYPSWPGRAMLIARTETVGANNQGSLAAWTSLADDVGATSTATKTWLATSDEKTRESHAEVDGTEVSLDGTFSVGEYDMTGPGDPNAGPEEICNCRCVLTYDFPEGQDVPADMADLTAADAPPPGTEPANRPDGSTPSGAFVLLMLSDADAQRVAVDGGEPASSMHVTLGYLAQPADSYDESVRRALLSSLAPLAANLPAVAEAFATAHLNANDSERDPCAVLLVQSDQLASLHDAVEQAIGETPETELDDTFPTWIPHVTIAYNADPSVIEPSVVNTELSFDRLVLGWGAEQTTVDPAVDYGGSLTAAQEAPVTAPADVAPPAAPPSSGGDTAAPDTSTEPEGITWSGPLGLLDTKSDYRIIASTGGRIRPLPLPLSWQRESGPEHDNSVVVGRILACEIRDGMIWGSGDFLDPMINFDSQQAMAQVDAGLGLISLDLEVTESGFATSDGTPIDPVLFDGDGDDICEVALEWAVGGATIVSFPAFEDARITLDSTEPGEQPGAAIMEAPIMGGTFAGGTPEPATINDTGDGVTLSDGSTVAVGDLVAYPGAEGATNVGTISAINADDSTVTITPPQDDDGTQPPDITQPVASLEPTTETAPTKGDGEGGIAAANDLLASSALAPYRAEAFRRSEPDHVQPLVYDPDTGDVYGHLAQWGTCHVGKLAESGKCVTAPKSQIDYSGFHLGTVFTDEGMLPVGKITVDTGHARAGLSASSAVAHYDNTGTAAAVVRASDGNHGVWVCGQAIHDASPSAIEAMLRSPLSGDWRGRETGHLELCAALAVNVPGFQVRRDVVETVPVPHVGMLRGEQVSLVAAGVVQRDTRRELDEIELPSGARIAKSDMESMVAAAIEAMQRGRKVPRFQSEAQDAAIRLARARLALSSR